MLLCILLHKRKSFLANNEERGQLPSSLFFAETCSKPQQNQTLMWTLNNIPIIHPPKRQILRRSQRALVARSVSHPSLLLCFYIMANLVLMFLYTISAIGFMAQMFFVTNELMAPSYSDIVLKREKLGLAE